MRFLFTIIAITLVSQALSLRSATTSIRTSRLQSTIGEDVPVAPPAPKPRVAAKWFPFGNLKAPKALDGTLAGDAGFDPLGFSATKENLYYQREAEIKHGRLAMLGAAGWPISELLHKELAGGLGLTSILASNDRAPSLLNGGLSQPYAASMLMVSIALAGYLEGKSMNDGSVFWGAEKPKGYVPGNLGFDPLGLYNFRKDKKAMETAEIKNGRLAMIAVTAYAFTEFLTGKPVVALTPYLF